MNGTLCCLQSYLVRQKEPYKRFFHSHGEGVRSSHRKLACSFVPVSSCPVLTCKWNEGLNAELFCKVSSFYLGTVLKASTNEAGGDWGIQQRGQREMEFGGISPCWIFTARLDSIANQIHRFSCGENISFQRNLMLGKYVLRGRVGGFLCWFFFLHFLLFSFPSVAGKLGIFKHSSIWQLLRSKIIHYILGCGLLEGRRNNKLPVHKKECCYYCLFL